MAHGLALGGRVASRQAAEVAHDARAPTRVHVDALARERRPSAVRAVAAIGLEGAHAAAEEDAFELLDVAERGCHEVLLRPPRGRSCACKLSLRAIVRRLRKTPARSGLTALL